MAIIIPADAPAVRGDRMLVEVRVGGVTRADARCESVTQSCGLQPTTCEVYFPMLRMGQLPGRVGDVVEVFVDRRRYSAAMFRGMIVAEFGHMSMGRNEPGFTATDVRAALNFATCSRDFNERSKVNGAKTEDLSLREITAIIWAEYLAHAATSSLASSLRCSLRMASIPEAAVGEFTCRGEPHGDALERLIQEFAPGAYRLRVEYGASSNTISAFEVGQGSVQAVVRGTRPWQTPEAQPHGRANVSDASESANYAAVINDVELECADVILETAVELTPAWRGSSDDELYDAMLAQAAAFGGEVLDYSDPYYADVGRRYRIPAITDLDGVSRHLDVARELVQSSYYSAAALWQKVGEGEGAPFIAWFLDNDSGDYAVMFDGFRVEGANLILDEPIWRWGQYPAQETYTPIIIGEEFIDATPAMSGNLFSGWAANMPAAESWGALEGFYSAHLDDGGSLIEALPYYDGLGNINYPTLTDDSQIVFDPDNGRVISRSRRVIFARHERADWRRLPRTIYLNAGFASKSPMRAATGRTGDVSELHVKRARLVGGYRKRVLRDFIKLTEAPESENSDFFFCKGSPISGTITHLDESSLLLTAAQAMAAQSNGPARMRERTLKRGDLGYKIGATLMDNGLNTGDAILQISYNLTARETALSVGNR